jgi:hypothetical protein
MNILDLLAAIQAGLADGSLNPDAIVVRPFCLCDLDNGFKEAEYVDQIFLRCHDLGPDLDGTHGPERVFYVYRQSGSHSFSSGDGTNPEDRQVMKLG